MNLLCGNCWKNGVKPEAPCTRCGRITYTISGGDEARRMIVSHALLSKRGQESCTLEIAIQYHWSADAALMAMELAVQVLDPPPHLSMLVDGTRSVVGPLLFDERERRHHIL